MGGKGGKKGKGKKDGKGKSGGKGKVGSFTKDSPIEEVPPLPQHHLVDPLPWEVSPPDNPSHVGEVFGQPVGVPYGQLVCHTSVLQNPGDPLPTQRGRLIKGPVSAKPGNKGGEFSKTANKGVGFSKTTNKGGELSKSSAGKSPPTLPFLDKTGLAGERSASKGNPSTPHDKAKNSSPLEGRTPSSSKGLDYDAPCVPSPEYIMENWKYAEGIDTPFGVYGAALGPRRYFNDNSPNSSHKFKAWITPGGAILTSSMVSVHDDQYVEALVAGVLSGVPSVFQLIHEKHLHITSQTILDSIPLPLGTVVRPSVIYGVPDHVESPPVFDGVKNESADPSTGSSKEMSIQGVSFRGFSRVGYPFQISKSKKISSSAEFDSSKNSIEGLGIPKLVEQAVEAILTAYESAKIKDDPNDPAKDVLIILGELLASGHSPAGWTQSISPESKNYGKQIYLSSAPRTIVGTRGTLLRSGMILVFSEHNDKNFPQPGCDISGSTYAHFILPDLKTHVESVNITHLGFLPKEFIAMCLDQCASGGLWYGQLPFFGEIAPFLLPECPLREELNRLSERLQAQLVRISRGLAFHPVPEGKGFKFAKHEIHPRICSPPDATINPYGPLGEPPGITPIGSNPSPTRSPQAEILKIRPEFKEVLTSPGFHETRERRPSIDSVQGVLARAAATNTVMSASYSARTKKFNPHLFRSEPYLNVSVCPDVTRPLPFPFRIAPPYTGPWENTIAERRCDVWNFRYFATHGLVHRLLVKMRKHSPAPQPMSLHRDDGKDVFRRADLPSCIHDALSTRRICRTYAALLDPDDNTKTSRWFHRSDRSPRLSPPTAATGTNHPQFFIHQHVEQQSLGVKGNKHTPSTIQRWKTLGFESPPDHFGIVTFVLKGSPFDSDTALRAFDVHSSSTGDPSTFPYPCPIPTLPEIFDLCGSSPDGFQEKLGCEFLDVGEGNRFVKWDSGRFSIALEQMKEKSLAAASSAMEVDSSSAPPLSVVDAISNAVRLAAKNPENREPPEWEGGPLVNRDRSVPSVSGEGTSPPLLPAPITTSSGPPVVISHPKSAPHKGSVPSSPTPSLGDKGKNPRPVCDYSSFSASRSVSPSFPLNGCTPNVPIGAAGRTGRVNSSGSSQKRARGDSSSSSSGGGKRYRVSGTVSKAKSSAPSPKRSGHSSGSRDSQASSSHTPSSNSPSQQWCPSNNSIESLQHFPLLGSTLVSGKEKGKNVGARSGAFGVKLAAEAFGKAQKGKGNPEMFSSGVPGPPSLSRDSLEHGSLQENFPSRGSSAVPSRGASAAPSRGASASSASSEQVRQEISAQISSLDTGRIMASSKPPDPKTSEMAEWFQFTPPVVDAPLPYGGHEPIESTEPWIASSETIVGNPCDLSHGVDVQKIDGQEVETVDAVISSGRFTFRSNSSEGCFRRTSHDNGPSHPHVRFAQGYFRGFIDVVRTDDPDQVVCPLVKDSGGFESPTDMFPVLTSDGSMGASYLDPDFVTSSHPPFLVKFGDNVMSGNTYEDGTVVIPDTLCPRDHLGNLVGSPRYEFDEQAFSRSSVCRTAAGFCKISADEWASIFREFLAEVTPVLPIGQDGTAIYPHRLNLVSVSPDTIARMFSQRGPVQQWANKVEYRSQGFFTPDWPGQGAAPHPFEIIYDSWKQLPSTCIPICRSLNWSSRWGRSPLPSVLWLGDGTGVFPNSKGPDVPLSALDTSRVFANIVGILNSCVTGSLEPQGFRSYQLCLHVSSKRNIAKMCIDGMVTSSREIGSFTGAAIGDIEHVGNDGKFTLWTVDRLRNELNNECVKASFDRKSIGCDGTAPGAMLIYITCSKFTTTPALPLDWITEKEPLGFDRVRYNKNRIGPGSGALNEIGWFDPSIPCDFMSRRPSKKRPREVSTRLNGTIFAIGALEQSTIKRALKSFNTTVGTPTYTLLGETAFVSPTTYMSNRCRVSDLEVESQGKHCPGIPLDKYIDDGALPGFRYYWNHSSGGVSSRPITPHGEPVSFSKEYSWTDSFQENPLRTDILQDQSDSGAHDGINPYPDDHPMDDPLPDDGADVA